VSILLRDKRREWNSVNGGFREDQMKQEQCDDSASMYLNTGQLMKMLSKCFAVNLGEHQVVLGVYYLLKKTRA
jgi:hypothetical protein